MNKEKTSTSNASSSVSKPAVRLVVMAHPGAETVVKKIWKKHCDEPFSVISWNGESLSEILQNIIADEKVADSFVLVPAGCVPCSKIDFSELQMPKVYVTKQEQFQYDCGLPVLFDKMALADFIPEHAEDADEVLLEAYTKAYLNRPVWVAISWGNYVSPVKRADPCISKVMEAFVRKKFITASAEGWKAIEPLLKETLLAK